MAEGERVNLTTIAELAVGALAQAWLLYGVYRIGYTRAWVWCAKRARELYDVKLTASSPRRMTVPGLLELIEANKPVGVDTRLVLRELQRYAEAAAGAHAVYGQRPPPGPPRSAA